VEKSAVYKATCNPAGTIKDPSEPQVPKKPYNKSWLYIPRGIVSKQVSNVPEKRVTLG